MIVENMKVIQHTTIAKNVYELILQGEELVNMALPGQFLHIKVSDGTDPLLRRPISICNIDKQSQQLTVIYRAEGIGTKLLAKKNQGEQISVLGPLGNGFPLLDGEEETTAILIGGGIGVPPLYELSIQLKQLGVTPIHVLGFASKEDIFYEEKFQQLGQTFIATMDGSYGEQGTVLQVINNNKLSFDCIFACGPTPMLKAIEDTYPNGKGYLSLEERMGCGIGACFACVCHVKNDDTRKQYKKVCTDGPVFPIGEVEL